MKTIALPLVMALASSIVMPSTGFGQHNHGDYGATVPAHPPKIALADPTNGKTAELTKIQLTDYEVWVVDRASTRLKYKLHLLDPWGWSTHQSPGDYPWNSSDTLFDSREDAVEEYRRLQRRFGGYIDFEIEAIAPEVQWTHVATFNTEGEALDFLDVILEAFPEYDGVVISVQRELVGLRK